MMAHASIEDKRKEIGITDDLVRLSVGIEDADDLIDDLKSISINSSSSFFEVIIHKSPILNLRFGLFL
jgi:hypothetical protein